jgi:hypothetical protein
MKPRMTLLLLCATLASCAATAIALGQSAEVSQAPARLKAYTTVKTQPAGTAASPASATGPTLPLWRYHVHSSRDGHDYTGVMVGVDPSANNQTVSVPTQIIPVVIQTNLVGLAINSNGIIGTTPGKTVLDPTAANSACLAAPNDVPLTLFQQSPIFNDASFTFGGTYVGDTQYPDAFQRANFWNHTHARDNHMLLSPVTTSTLYIDVPEAYGLALATTSLGSPPFCAPLGIIDINWFDSYLNVVVIPSLASQGVNQGSLPIFLLANVVMASPVADINTCCILGYHGDTAGQTYSPMDFDTSGLFGPGIFDTAIAAHEVDEWQDDPMGGNPTPPWGNVGQVAGCQTNLEVGDPLTGTALPTVTMPNGYAYHLQELAFFSWFYGGLPLGVNGWYSDNDTFTTNAGPPCK